MLNEIIVFILQTLFNIFKVLEIKYTYQNKIPQLLLTSVFMNLISLTSIYYAINDLLNGEITIVIFYITGSVLGKYLGMRLGNTRNQIWKKINSNNEK